MMIMGTREGRKQMQHGHTCNLAGWQSNRQQLLAPIAAASSGPPVHLASHISEVVQHLALQLGLGVGACGWA
jgi:hypothetical protein